MRPARRLHVLPPAGFEILLSSGVLQFQGHHFMELQEEGVQADLVQERAEELRVFRAEIDSVLHTDVSKRLLQ